MCEYKDAETRSQAMDQDTEETRAVTISRIGIIALRHLRTLIVWPIVGLSVAVFVAFLGPDTYTAQSSFSPSSQDRSSVQVSRLASQIGVNVPTGGAETSPEFYVDLIRSPHILRKVLRTEFVLDSVRTKGGGTTRGSRLLDVLVPEDGRRALRLEWGVERLRRKMNVRSDPQTGVVTVEVTLEDPHLAHQVVEQVVDLVNEFNVNQRQSEAAAEREFVGGQLEQAKRELRAAEDSLSTFLEENRGYRDSPTLVFRQQRLQRRVDRAQQLVASLEQSFQEAKIREVRKTPVITVIGSPTVPAEPDSRQISLKGLAGLILGSAGALVIVIIKEAVRRERQHESELWARMIDEWQEIKARARNLQVT